VNAGGATRDFSAGTIISGSPGWYADLGSDGDRVNIDPKLVSGALVTASIVPSNTACSPGGTGWVNLFNYKTGQATSSRTDSPVVGINIMFIQDKPIISFVTAYHPTPEKYTGEGIPDTSSGFSGQRVIWRELIPN